MKVNVEALKDLKPKQQTKAIEDKSSDNNNQSIISNIFNNLIKKKKEHNEWIVLKCWY